MLDGLLGVSWGGALVYALVATHLTIISVTVFLHRHQAHRALTLHPAVSHFFRFWLWLTTAMVTREWVAVHRKHHATCESADDPHSPRVFGLMRVLFGGALLYRREADREETLAQYGKGTPDDWIERRLYTPYPVAGILTCLAVDLLLLGPMLGLAVWAVQMVWIPFWAAGVINGLGHALGYRNYQCPDASTNIVPWGIVIGGEELHNNHHAFPASARLSSRWWEFDLGWFYIRLLETLRLARVKRVAPPPARIEPAGCLDTEAVRAILHARFQVLARYGRDVMRQVHRQELRRFAAVDRRLKARLRPVRRLLLREESLLDEAARQRLSQALEQSQALRTAYQFRARLQAIWQSAAGPEKVLPALQAWCREAEASGIESLQAFARRMGGWRLREM